MGILEARLNAANIPYEYKPTTKAFDPYVYARELDYDVYSILVSAGGDGTIHEIVNGMLARKDGKKLPVAIIPNGSGDDLASSIGIRNVDQAIDAIVAATTTHFDTVRILVDREDEMDIPDELERLSMCRHMLVNSCISMPATIAHKAIPYKACCGKNSYTIATLVEAIKCNFIPDLFDVELDGDKVTSLTREDLNSILFFCTNGKYTGGGMIVNPFSCINDGLLDFGWIEDEDTMGLLGIAGALDKAKKGGIHTFEGKFRFKRGKTLKLSWKGKNHAN
jgi:diacylglycerol kinase family enzyme